MRVSQNSVLVVVDIQEAFRNVIPDFERIVTRTAIAIKGFQTLGLPILITEQYPKGLGKTVIELMSLLPPDFKPIEKTTFSSFAEEKFETAFNNISPASVAVCGLEAHICVNQTVCDLVDEDCDVHILEDCIASRNKTDFESGIKKMIAMGAIPSTLEMALFDIMEDSKHPAFRAIQKLIK
jgi:nicotinamidase-related amidase